MNPTLKDKDILLLEKYDRDFSRFDIVVIRHQDTKIIKRIIGVAGDSVKYVGNRLYINDEYVKEDFLPSTTITDNFNLEDLNFTKIPSGYYFVLGDNRRNSTDSRYIGLIAKEDIVGKAVFRLFPFNKIGKI